MLRVQRSFEHALRTCFGDGVEPAKQTMFKAVRDQLKRQAKLRQMLGTDGVSIDAVVGNQERPSHGGSRLAFLHVG